MNPDTQRWPPINFETVLGKQDARSHMAAEDGGERKNQDKPKGVLDRFKSRG